MQQKQNVIYQYIYQQKGRVCIMRLKDWTPSKLFFMWNHLIPKNTADGVTLPPADLLRNNSPSSAIPVILPSTVSP